MISQTSFYTQKYLQRYNKDARRLNSEHGDDEGSRFETTPERPEKSRWSIYSM